MKPIGSEGWVELLRSPLLCVPLDGCRYAQPILHCAALMLLTLAYWLAAAAASAHDGHDLQPAPAAASAPGAPRLVASSESYELVAVLEGLRLTIYLDRFQDNAPVTDAQITVTINDEAVVAEPTAGGTYRVLSGQFGHGGLFEFIFDIRAPQADDLLIGKLSLATGTPARSAASQQPWYERVAGYLRHGAEDHLMLLTLTLLMGLALGFAIRRGRARVVPVLLLVVPGLVVPSMDHAARAHEGHDIEGPAPQSAVPGNAARRLPDGKVFVPKPTQRILDVRTLVAKPETVPKSVVLVGRVITNPNRSGLVQSINGGRVVPPEQGLARIGQAVGKGDVLATIEPPMAMADRTTISERMGELEQMIAVAEAKLRRLRAMAERQVVPQALVTEMDAELEGLYRRRAVVGETRIAPEVLRAPVDGVVAVSRVVAGQVIQPQDVLFQVVDPHALWIEAYDYGESNPAALKHATAVAAGNATMQLGLQGWSRTLQQQATVLQFEIADPPPSISVGQPVTVTAQRADTASGFIVERDAVVRGGNGQTIVWRHVEPESFEARPVRTEPFDATHLLVAAGIEDGERIVTRGAELINQIR